jgi:putative hydrolase of HD superfamily
MAEGILRQLAKQAGRDDIIIDSAGTLRIEDQPASEYAQLVCAEHGIDIRQHRSKGVSEELLNAREVILCMTRAHMIEVSAVAPQAKERIHLLTEYAGVEAKDIADPIGRSYSVYRDAYNIISALLTLVMDKLAGSNPAAERLQQQLAFILELDKLKDVLRQSYLLNSGRRENSAEHSWHVGMMAFVLAEHANEPVDAAKVAKMMLIHDIVEIDAGDAYIYDEHALAKKSALEQKAAERLFGLLPPEQSAEFRQLWQAYEDGDTPEARFGAALDRLMPLMHNFYTQGRSWQEHGIREAQVLARNNTIADGSAALWETAQKLIAEAVDKGWLKKS